MSEAKYYLTILPETRELESGIRDAMSRAERGLKVAPKFDTSGAQRAGQDAGKGISRGVDSADPGKGLSRKLARNLGDGSALGKQYGSRLSAGIDSALSVAGGMAIAKVGSKISGALGSAMRAGFGRLTQIDSAQFKLKSLGNEASTVASVMQDATAAVKGTAFGLDAAATTAASAVAAGIKPGEQLTKYLSLTADTAAIAGTSLDEMGSIFNKVQGSGKAMTLELRQLADRGLPIFQWLQDEFHVSGDALQDMVAQGAVDSETFRRVIEKNIGGAAKGMGGSFVGSIANMKAAMSRFGAEVMGPIFKGVQPLATGLMGVFDKLTAAIKAPMGNVTTVVEQWAKGMSDKMQAWADGPGMQKVIDFFGRVGDSIKALATGGDGGKLGDIVQSFKNIGPSLQAAGSSFATIGATLAAIGPEVLSSVLVPALQLVAGALKFMADNASWAVPTIVGLRVALVAHSALVGTVAVATKAFGVAMAVWSGITKAATAAQWLFNVALTANPIGLIIAAVVGLAVAIWAFFTKTEVGRQLWAKIWGGIKMAVHAVVEWFKNTAVPFLKASWDMIAAGAMWLWHNVIEPVWEGIKTAIKFAIDFIKAEINGWVAIFHFIEGVWQGLVDTAHAVWQGIVDKFTGVVNFVKELPGKITSAAKGMWDGIKDAFKSMINSLIDMWNGLADKMTFTVPDIPGVPRRGESVHPIPNIPRLATGGRISGPGTGTSDSILARVANGEFITNAAATAANLPLLRAINAGVPLWQLMKALPRFAEGGIVSARELVSFARGVEGKPYKWGGVNWGDCSGAVSAIANYATGRDPFGSRFATGSEAAELASRGFKPGLGPKGSLSVGWFNGGPYGGHTAATLPDGTHFEMGGARGNGQFGGQAAGADDPQFTDHAHLPPEVFSGLDGGAPTIGSATSARGMSSGSGGWGSGAGSGGGFRSATDDELKASSGKVDSANSAAAAADRAVDDKQYALDKAKRDLETLKGKKHTEAQLQDAQHRVEKAERDLAVAQEKQTKAHDKATDALNADNELRTKGKAEKGKGGKGSGGMDGSDLGKTFVSGMLESIGLDGSVLSNPLEWPTIKSLFAGINFMGGLLSGKGQEGEGDSPGGFAGGVADNLGLGALLKGMGTSPINGEEAGWTPQSGSPALAPGEFNPATIGGGSVAEGAVDAMSAFVPSAAKAAQGDQPAQVDNSINFTGPVGMDPVALRSQIHSEQNARTRSTVRRV
ncbi:endolysin [Mycobacterium phage Mufasa]|uniref:Tape measure protein n=1 Tax=Mycobacterium phage Mufasa TaxID=1718600 RepID=A0A0M3UKA7_9CAUD|nr:endolysin [Mycobacterium phage Mufasa]ALF00451.1 tape measure protein [Mycobacterium phage Mufasa]